VPLIGDEVTFEPDRLRKSSGDADAISRPGIRRYEANGAGLLFKIEKKRGAKENSGLIAALKIRQAFT
jgi:hypothetical protein